MKKIFITILISTLFSFSCKENSTEPSDTNQNDHIYPLAIGNQWIYTDELGNQEAEIKIIQSGLINENEIFVFEGPDEMYFNFDPTSSTTNYGLFIKNNELWGYKNYEQLILPEPLIVGHKHAMNNYPNESELEILALNESVSVHAGKFDCVKFSITHRHEVSGDTLRTDSYWMSRGVGIVKLVRSYPTFEKTALLKNYKIN